MLTKLSVLSLILFGRRGPRPADPLADELTAARQRLNTATSDFFDTISATLDRVEGHATERPRPHVRPTKS